MPLLITQWSDKRILPGNVLASVHTHSISCFNRFHFPVKFHVIVYVIGCPSISPLQCGNVGAAPRQECSWGSPPGSCSRAAREGWSLRSERGNPPAPSTAPRRSYCSAARHAASSSPTPRHTSCTHTHTQHMTTSSLIITQYSKYKLSL